jgi:hypothetical protein
MSSTFQHAILFTGHMIDAPGRAHPRFPARAEPAARAAIHNALEALLAAHPGPTMGIAGAASGGDILFHEACFKLAIPTHLYLALPIDRYLEASVVPAGPSVTGNSWIERFHAITARLGSAVHVLDDSVILPGTLTRGKPLNIWARTNLWMVSEAISLAPHRSLLALWDGRSGDGPGGTEHLVSVAPTLGIDVAPIIPTQSLFT